MNKEAMRKLTHWKAYWEGYKEAYDVEDMSPVAKRAAKEKFGRWWENNKK